MPIDVDALVVANTRLSSHYNVLVLDAAAIAADARPGQFVMLKPGHGTEPLLRRPFSVFQIRRGRNGEATGLSILNKKVGVGTAWLYEAEVGHRVPCLGPLGRPFTAVEPPAEVWMVAGGVGLAPFATLAEALARDGTRCTLFYGARRDSELFHLDLFERLGVSLVLATEDGSRGHRGLISEPLARALEAQRSNVPRVIYACGPTPMMRAVADLARRHGRRAEVSLEPVMGCGLGGCYSCVVKARREGGEPHYVRSCIEGPVFDASDVVWDDLDP